MSKGKRSSRAPPQLNYSYNSSNYSHYYHPKAPANQPLFVVGNCASELACCAAHSQCHLPHIAYLLPVASQKHMHPVHNSYCTVPHRGFASSSYRNSICKRKKPSLNKRGALRIKTEASQLRSYCQTGSLDRRKWESSESSYKQPPARVFLKRHFSSQESVTPCIPEPDYSLSEEDCSSSCDSSTHLRVRFSLPTGEAIEKKTPKTAAFRLKNIYKKLNPFSTSRSSNKSVFVGENKDEKLRRNEDKKAIVSCSKPKYEVGPLPDMLERQQYQHVVSISKRKKLPAPPPPPMQVSSGNCNRQEAFLYRRTPRESENIPLPFDHTNCDEVMTEFNSASSTVFESCDSSEDESVESQQYGSVLKWRKSLSNPSTLNSCRTNPLSHKSGIKDLNYESGIVSRLRQRFSQIDSSEAKDFEAASCARRKRFSSVDDVLATCQASHNNNCQKQGSISTFCKTQSFWQSVPSSLQTSSSSDSISRNAVQTKTRSIYSNCLNQKPEARPRNGLTQKSASNSLTQPNGSHGETQEATYVLVRPKNDSTTDLMINAPAKPARPLEWSHPHLHLSSSTNFGHVNSTVTRSHERLVENDYCQSQYPASRPLYTSCVDENNFEPISKLRERFERCSRAQKPDSLSRPCTMPRSRSAHVYPSVKILENIRKFENGNKEKKKPEYILEATKKNARSMLNISPPADPQPNGLKQMHSYSNQVVNMHEKSIDKPAYRLESNDVSPPPEEPHPCLLRAKPLESKVQDNDNNPPTISGNSVTSCEVDLKLEKSVEMKGQIFVPLDSPVLQAGNQSGKEEMQNLLNKFNQKRGEREAFRSSTIAQSDGPKADVRPQNIGVETMKKLDQPWNGNNQPECATKTSEYPKHLIRPNVPELSAQNTGPDAIYAIPSPTLDNLSEKNGNQSESTTCPDSSVGETCSHSSSTSPSESYSTLNGAQPRKSLSAKYFEEKQKSGTSFKSSLAAEDELIESALPTAKAEPITQTEEEEENLSQTTSAYEQPTELFQPENESEEARLEEDKENLEFQTSSSTNTEAKGVSKQATDSQPLVEEISCLPDIGTQNDSSDDEEDSNEDFSTDDFEYSTSLKESLAKDYGCDGLDQSWKSCLLPEYSILASDGNPVRHSLLSLADPEDIPELLAAMAEEPQFVFEDYSSSQMASTCGIIQLSDKRKPKQFAGRITFVEDPPQVFAYLDESSAKEDGEWQIGYAITFEDYQKMSQSVQEEAAQQQLELAKWRQTMQNKYSDFQEDSLSSDKISRKLCPGA